MRCPNCNALISDNRSQCPYCGQTVDRSVSFGEAAAQTASIGMGFAKNARLRKRMEAVVSADQIVNARVYTIIIFAVILWGLLINVLTCYFIGDVTQYGINSVVFLILYLVCVVAGVIMSQKSRKPGISFLGYNLVVIPFGLLISSIIAENGGVEEPIVGEAFLYTLLVTGGMSAAAIAFPKLFSKLGGILLGLLGGLLLCEIVMLILGKQQTAMDWIIAGVFALYVGYDVYRAQQFPKTVDNAVDSALDIYMDIGNLFIRILLIMASSKKDD